MSYLNVLLSATEEQVQGIKADSRRLLRPTSLVAVGHVWILPGEATPLYELLSEVMDGGQTLSPAFRHPLRAPIYHEPRQVRSLSEELARAWQQPYAAELKGDGFGQIRVEFEEILGLFHRASRQGECIASVLLPPTDVEGCDWVKVPFEAIPRRGMVELGRAEGLPLRSPGPWSVLRIFGSVAGLGILGALGLCYWRYGRRTRVARRTCQEEG